MLDFTTTLVGLSYAVLAFMAFAVTLGIFICLVVLVKNLPKGIRAIRAATESSVCMLAFCWHNETEEFVFSRMQEIFGQYFLYGVCGIYSSMAKLFAYGAEFNFFAQRRAAHSATCHSRKEGSVFNRGISADVLSSHFKLSVVMKQ